jgi:hypothetical protein
MEAAKSSVPRKRRKFLSLAAPETADRRALRVRGFDFQNSRSPPSGHEHDEGVPPR